MLLLIVTVLVLVAQALLSLLVLSRNTKNLRSVAFSLLSFSLLFWAALSYAYEAFPGMAENIMVVRLTMFFVVLQNSFFLLFAKSLGTKHINKQSRKFKTYLALSVITAVLSLTPVLFVKLAEGPRGVYPVGGPGMLLFIIHAFTSVFVGFKSLIRELRRTSGSYHRQLVYIGFGSVVLWGIVPITNFVLSLTLQTTFFGIVSPLYCFAFSSLIAYAILKHHLFDIRPIVARSVGYVLALIFVGLAYGFTAFYLLDLVLFPDIPVDHIGKQIMYTSLALVSGLSFVPAKKIFDRLSNKLFYRDAYDAQEFIDNFTSLLVSNPDVSELLAASSGLIEANLKSSFTSFILKSGEQEGPRLEGKLVQKLDKDEVDKILELASEAPSGVVAVEDLEMSRFRSMYRILNGLDVALVIKLTNLDTLIGVLVVGSKQSGNIYSAQDREIFEIIADELALAIENALHLEEIEHFNETLQEEVNDATRQLRHSNEKLKSLDETKDEFISMASHQLRTPLTSIKGYLSMVLDGDVGELNDQQKKMLTQAFTSSQRMNYLISDLLNVSRLRTGKFVIEPSEVYLPDLVEGEIGQLLETARAKNQSLTFDKPTQFPVLQLDETKTRQVVMNFMDNALHYTPEGGKVRVELEAKPKSIELRVVDNGLGVPKSEQHKLFTKFFRAGNARQARPDGTGLGLFMAKKVIVAQGGALIFKSQEGKGSTFGFIFPRHK